MAKDKFERTKPHVNVGATVSKVDEFVVKKNVKRLGISPYGATQIFSAQIVTSQDDRYLLAQIVVMAVGSQQIHRSLWQAANFTFEMGGLPCDYVVTCEPPKLTQKFKWLGTSQIGAMQVFSAQVVTSQDDRNRLAQLVAQAVGPTPSKIHYAQGRFSVHVDGFK